MSNEHSFVFLNGLPFAITTYTSQSHNERETR